MAIIKLTLLTKQQADELQAWLKQWDHSLIIREGTFDMLGGGLVGDNHLEIEHPDQHEIEHALDEYFNPREHNWKEFLAH